MLILISPSKTQDFETPAPIVSEKVPPFLTDSEQLIELLRQLTVSDIGRLMTVSEKIATLNHGRFAAWRLPFYPEAARPAAYAFKGDVYDGLAAESLTGAEMSYADTHLRILSGLYGVLTPLTNILPYRLEMGIPLKNPRGRNLYQFWGTRITDWLNQELNTQTSKLVVNLASTEYSSAVQPDKLAGQWITPIFKDQAKSGELKIISFYAKRARGSMARWLIQNRISKAEDLLTFNVDGYQYQAQASTPDSPVFIRQAAGS